MRKVILSVVLLYGLAGWARAAVIRVDAREEPAGPYTRITGKVYFAVDPRLAANRIITDIDNGPRNDKGLVEFSADLYMLKPARHNGTILFEVSNRGRKALSSIFNTRLDGEPSGGSEDNFLPEQGFTVVWLGWQWDVPPDPPGLMRFYAPAARGIKGVVRADYVPDEKIKRFYVADRTHIAYPVSDPASVRMTVRDRANGARREIPRSQWRLEEDRTHIFMESGFEPGRIYEVTYIGQDPALAGLGPAGIRDFISYLKQKEGYRHAIAIGSSQSGRFLRKFLYDGFNAGEQGQRVFDGIWANVSGGGRGGFNHRFAQPSRDARPFFNFLYPTDIFPFSLQPQTDPETGRTDGLLTRAEKASVIPKMFFTHSSYEYYGRVASLIHTTLDGKHDLPPPPDARIYFIAGAQHGWGQFPPRREGTQNPANVNDYRWVMRALLVAMHRWVTGAGEPPESRYPKIAENQLVLLAAVKFPRIAGVTFPARLHQAYRVDYGPEFLTKGIIANEPPKVGNPFPVLVPQVNPEDGNETSGIRLPVVEAPLGTFTGWNLRDPKIGAPDELFSMVGSYLQFPGTRAERQKIGDPRRSIEELYPNRNVYLEKITAAARNLARQGYVLGQDIPKIVENAAAQWDYTMGSSGRTAARQP
jgi:hypothetical protein